ncbi:MAG TPA: terminase family protein, partial [Verrucomicrobiae bacterium]
RDGKPVQVQVLRFANGQCVYCLSSNPDAIVGKSGHVILDEFALHKDQRELYAVAKPVTQWGGTLTIISTHRGIRTVFNDIITDIKERGNKMGWSLHTIAIQTAVDQGIVEKIDAATGGKWTERWKAAEKSEVGGRRSEVRDQRSEVGCLREFWLSQQRAECLDEEQWLQEYCCLPADESTAFITYEMITACEDDTAKRDFAYLSTINSGNSQLFIGFDVARTTDLSVIDVEEKVGDVFWERMRIEMRGKTFAEQESELFRLLALPQVKRACVDATGLGMQLAERAVARYGYRVEAVRFSANVKEELAFPLRAAHEERTLRYSKDEKLRADLRGIKKETTASGNIRFVGEAADSHCDRFWAKALALHAGKRGGATFNVEIF